MKAIALEFPRYGIRRMTRQLQQDGRQINHKRVERLMKELGLQVKPRRRWVATTDSRHGMQTYPNLLKGIVPDRMNQVWAADMTYIGLGRGFVFLAVILDLYSRKVIGWALGRRMGSDLTLAALRAALESRGDVSGCILHSDQGVQYACWDYVQLGQGAGLRMSMSRRGNPYDNAHVESFMKTLKVEEVYLRDYRTYEEVTLSIPRFIEAVYNQKRLHSGINYQSPNDFEAQQIKKASGLAYA